jgi:hypothetical protein
MGPRAAIVRQLRRSTLIEITRARCARAEILAILSAVIELRYRNPIHRLPESPPAPQPSKFAQARLAA